MRRLAHATKLVGALIAVVTTVAVAGPAAAATPPPPQSDPFYQPPAGYESQAPGTVLRSRTISAAAFGTLPQQVQAWQLLYRTTDTQNQPQATVTTVLLPANATPSASRPLLSYQVAENSVAAQCSMSYRLQQGAGIGNVSGQAEILLIDAAVRQGWAVSVPDYEGPQGAYVGGKQAGQAVLDGIRATENFAPLGLDGVHTKVGMWGYSGGALASGWAAELQPGYAPELNVKGVAEGGLPVNPTNVFKQANGSMFAGIALAGIAGLSEAHPDLQQFLDTYLTPEGKAAIAKVKTQCNVTNILTNMFTNVDRYFTIPDPLNQPVPKAILAADTLGQHTPTAPMFVYQSLNDELIPHADVDAVVAKYCAEQGTVTYHRDLLSEHVTLVVTGAPDALNWLNDRLSDKPPASGCTTRTVLSSLLSPGALTTFGRLLWQGLLGLGGQPIVPGGIG